MTAAWYAAHVTGLGLGLIGMALGETVDRLLRRYF